jgi:hypothetical protein
VIESRGVKWFVVVALLSVGAYFVVNAKPSRRGVSYIIGAVFAAPALYVLLRVHPRTTPRSTQASILGDVPAFLARVPELDRQFQEWGASRGLRRIHEPGAFLEWLWKHRSAVGRDWNTMLPMATAAYGELIRRKQPRAQWAIRGGDAVVEIPRRPWSRTRVAYEIHETVFLDI